MIIVMSESGNIKEINVEKIEAVVEARDFANTIYVRIPAEVAKRLNIKQGTKFLLIVKDNKLIYELVRP